MAEKLYTWEENAERRLLILEAKMDKILDPEKGIYPQMTSVEGKLKSWAITILTAIVISGAVQIVTNHP